MTNTTATAEYIAPLGDTVLVTPRNGFAAPRCELERVAIVVSDGDDDEEYAEVVVRPNDLRALIYAKNRLWSPGWHFQESWGVAHPDLEQDDMPKFMAVDGPVWEF